MSRIRSIKPEFFFDEELAKLDSDTKLFFIGLWTQADRKGCFEWRPEKLKAHIFPYTNFDAITVLERLQGRFLAKYEVAGKTYGYIYAFLKHQRPHHTEKDSDIPKPPSDILKERLNNGSDTVNKRMRSGCYEAVVNEINDITVVKEDRESPSFSETDFDKIWTRYPNKDGKKQALKHFMVSVKTKEDFEAIEKALKNYLGSDRVKKGFVKNGSTWFNNWRDWIEFTEQGAQNGKNQTAGIKPESGKYDRFEK